MKIRTMCLGGVALALLLWGCWSFAYNRGYSRGALDEFACWRQEPTATGAAVLVGKRDLWMYPGGKKVADPVTRVRDLSANNIPSRFSP